MTRIPPDQISSSPIASLSVRRATRGDAPVLLRLITALAVFEGLTPPDAAARARLIEDGFGSRPRFEAWLAFGDDRSEPIAYAITVDLYSSFLGRPTLFLEDLFVLEEFRKRGVGQALLRHCIRLACERGCGRMEWTALNWNTNAQSFYERLGARRLSDWLLYRLDRAALEKLAAAIPANS